MYGIESVGQVFETYMGPTAYLSLFLVCIVYGFCHGDERGRKRLIFAVILSVLFIFNGLSLRLMGKVTGITTYYRFIWAVPVLPMIAWVGTKAVMERKKLWEKAAVCVLLLALFGGGTSTFLTEGSIRVPENIYNLPGDVIAVCEIIDKHKEKEHPVVAFESESQTRARLYDPTLVWAISRKAYQKHNNAEGYEEVSKKYRPQKAIIRAVNHGMKDEPERLAEALAKEKVDYIVTFSSFGMDAYLEQVGYGLVDSTGTRSVYARKENDLEVNQ